MKNNQADLITDLHSATRYAVNKTKKGKKIIKDLTAKTGTKKLEIR